MNDDERPAGWRTALVRSVAPVGFLLALVLLMLMPLAGVSCSRDSGGPVHLCYTGEQLISGRPSVDMSDIFAGSAQQTAELRDAIVNTVAPSGAVPALTVVAALVLTLGALSVVVGRPARRATVAAITALAGAVLLTVTEIVVVVGLSDGAHYAVHLFAGFDAGGGSPPDAGDVVRTGPGFWLALTVLVAVAGFSIGSLARLRATAMEEEFRRPGGD